MRIPSAGSGAFRMPAVALSLCLLLGANALPSSAAAQSAVAGLPDFTVLVDQVGPAVVNIRTLERMHQSRGGLPEADDNLQEFFRRFGIPMPRRPDPRGNGGNNGGDDDEPVQRGIGSGFILTGDGFVMTNAHVVEGADEVVVTLSDKREFKAKIVGSDKRTDVAVVKIDATGLPFVRIGDVGKTKVGEWVLAFGSPFNLENTVTAGIVSAKQRDTGDYLPLIQTDVAVNPGNSGGPLVNMRGEVIGINSQIYSRSGGYMGISFAIPIDEAIRVADQLRATGRVVRGRIGVSIAPVTKDVAEAIGLGKASGALVQNVEAGGPADKAGVQPGDIVTRVDGKAVDRSTDLPRMIGSIKPGSKVTLQVFRAKGHAYQDVPVTVGEFPADTTTAGAKGGGEAAIDTLGLAVSDLTEQQKRDLKASSGVRVERAEGPAARAGIREGDVILSIANTEIADSRQFKAVVQKLDRTKPISVLVRRGEWVNYLVIRPAR
jgi:serine protease Do